MVCGQTLRQVVAQLELELLQPCQYCKSDFYIVCFSHLRTLVHLTSDLKFIINSMRINFSGPGKGESCVFPFLYYEVTAYGCITYKEDWEVIFVSLVEEATQAFTTNLRSVLD